ncbi:MAG TPA: DUF748 domain-containing protein [Burkholderiales bacterium]|nr:DUF748 domain-containing protein [Burkholderiales bacterium]
MRLRSLLSRAPGERFLDAWFRQRRLAGRGLAKKLLKVALWVVGILALLSLLGFFAVPPIAKHLLVKNLTELLGRQVAIREIKFNPFTLAVTLRGFSVAEPGGREVFVSFEELFVDLQAESVIRRGPILREIRLEQPYVHIVHRGSGGYNFSDLVTKFQGTDQKAALAQPPKKSEPLRFSLNNIQVTGGKVVFDDQPKRAQHALTDMNIAVPFISNLPYRLQQYVVPSFSAKFNGTPIALDGRSKPFANAPEAQLDLNIYALNIPQYLEYVPVPLPVKIPSATLDVRLTASFTQYPDKPPVLVLSGRTALSNLAVTQLDGRALLNLARLEVGVESATVFARDVRLGNILVRSPEVFIRRDRDGSLNWMQVVQKGAREAQPSPEPRSETEANAQPLKLRIEEARIEQGQIHFADDAAPKPFRTDIEGLLVVFRKFALPQVDPAEFTLEFGTRFGESVKHSSMVFASPLSVDGTLEVKGVKPKNYAAYYAHLIRFDVEDGMVGLSTRLRAAQAEQNFAVTASGLQVTLEKLRLRKREAKEDFLSLPVLEVKDVDLDSAKHAVEVGEVASRQMKLKVERQKDGTIDLTRLTAQEAAAAPAAAATAPAAPAASGAKQSSETWQWLVKKIALDRYSVTFEDQVPGQGVTHVAEPIKLSVDGLSNRQGSKANVALTLGVNKTGKVSLAGPVGINPLSADLNVDVQSIDLVPVQPYLEDKLNILLTSGDVLVRGKWQLTPPEPGPMTTIFKGEIGVNNFASVDKATSEDFLKWKSLFVSGIDTTYRAFGAGRAVFGTQTDAAAQPQPFTLKIDEVALSDFYSRLIIYPSGRLNVQNILAGSGGQPAEEAAAGSPKADAAAADKTSPPAKSDKPAQTQQAAPPTPPAAPPPPTAIAKITLQGGNVNFTDLFIKPNYSANLTEIGGSVTGLSSEMNTTADVDIRGRFAKTAPVEIKGKINPLAQKTFLDIKANVRDIELGPFTPYSGKYVGYAIEKGKMSFDVHYKIEDRKLAASNRLTLDQLTFGEKVDSPTATKLPVQFAVSLLKDRNGVIDVNLPISGSLDDPKFSIGGIVLQIIFNLIEKAVTSPFDLIGSLVGGGGTELSYVAFDPGSAALTPAADEKLNKLKTALSDRPALKLDASGRSDPNTDREALRRQRFEQQVKAQKLKDLVKKGSSVSSVDQVKIEPDEYEKYLERAYKEAKFPKPRNFLGFQKDLPKEEMEKLMLTNTAVTDDDLLQLANQRGQATKDFITRGDQVAVERVFLLAPKLEPAKGDDKLPGSRVDFSLK